MEDESSRSHTITLPDRSSHQGRSRRVRDWTDTLAGGIVYAMAVMIGSVVAGFVILTVLTLAAVLIVERATGVSIT